MDLAADNSINFDQCLKCTICTAYCPVVRVNPDFPGPKQAGPDGARLRLNNPNLYDEALKYCLNCKRCEVVCPSDVRIGDIIQMARARYDQHRPSLRDRLLASTDLVGRLGTAMAPMVNLTTGAEPAKLAMDVVLKIDKHRKFPHYAVTRFRNWYKQYAPDQNNFAHHVAYFHGCYVNYNFPQLGKDLIQLLNALGYGVHLLDKEKCCGVAMLSNRLTSRARKQAEFNLKYIRKAVTQDHMPVVTTSSTCTMTLRDEYPRVLHLENDDVRQDIQLATFFIYKLLESGSVRLAFKPDFRLKAAYHAPCHLEKLGWQHYSVALLRQIPNLDLTVLDSNCCGIAGTYGFKKENYEYAQLIGRPLFEQIEDTEPEVVVTDCETCKWQIEMSTGVKVLHPVSLLAKALDIATTRKLNQVNGKE